MPRVTRNRLTSWVLRPLSAVQKSGNARQEDESRRAEMRHPACQEQRRVGHIARIEAAIRKKIAGVVERHHDHNQAAQGIDGIRDASGRPLPPTFVEDTLR